MARITVAGSNLRLTMTRAEKLQTLHSDIEVPLAHVASVDPTHDLWSHIRGVRAPGTGIPFRLLLATMRFKGGRDFCIAHYGKPGVVVNLRDENFERLLVATDTFDTAVAVADEVARAKG